MSFSRLRSHAPIPLALTLTVAVWLTGSSAASQERHTQPESLHDLKSRVAELEARLLTIERYVSLDCDYPYELSDPSHVRVKPRCAEIVKHKLGSTATGSSVGAVETRKPVSVGALPPLPEDLPLSPPTTTSWGLPSGPSAESTTAGVAQVQSGAVFAASPDCDPPFLIDSSNVKHFKPECLRQPPAETLKHCTPPYAIENGVKRFKAQCF